MKLKKFLAFVLNFCLLLSAGIFTAGAENISTNNDNVDQIISSLIDSIPQEEFGGIYIDANGKIVLNVTDNYSAGKRVAMSNEISEPVKIKRVKYSLNELEAMKAAFEPYMREYNIATLDANEVTNTVDIELFESNESINNLINSLNVVDPDVVNVTVLDKNLHISLTIANTPPQVS